MKRMPEAAAQRNVPTPQEQILGIVDNHWQGRCVGVAARLELADQLANGPLHIDVLAERTQTHAPSLYRMLRALESTGIFTQTSPRVFANTPQSECLRRHAPGSQWAWIRICLCPDSFVEDGWSGLLLAVTNGKTGYDQVRGQSAWEFMQSNPEQHTNFNSAMRDLSAAMTPAVTASYDWSKIPVIADIGGGIGSQLSSILDAHPSVRGILFDQPSVVAEAPAHDRMGRVGGDFFTEIPVQADAYLMRWVIHDWADEKAVSILKNVRKAAPPDARVVLVEWVIPETAEFDSGKWMDINMLVNAGGRERTAAEFRSLYEQAGFELEDIIPTPSPLRTIIGKSVASAR
jgi:hypothetical protein